MNDQLSEQTNFVILQGLDGLWRWQARSEGWVSQSELPFKTLNECLADAKRNGYGVRVRSEEPDWG
jgi:hypothetical protein